MDLSLSEILGIENEYELLNKQAKSPEEIEKWCTKEDMPEVKRCVHLLKKGYEIQKVSVINNLDRYMTEAGANEELFSLIIDSLLDWDDKMQKECAASFIKPLELDLINRRNKEKVAKAAVQITTDDDNAENETLLDSWIKVLETVVSRLDIKFMAENVTKVIKDIPGLKHPLPKRKRGNRLVFAVAKNIGEDGIDKDPLMLKLIMSICDDNNHRIRKDGCIFLQEYFKQDKEKIIQHPRFQEVYLPLLMDFLNDEDPFIQLNAIEATCEVIDQLSTEQVEKEFVPCVLNFMDIDSQPQQEILQKTAEIFGVVINCLASVDQLLEYKDQFISYYKEICDHNEDNIRMKAVYNLPCMNLLFKPVSKEIGLSFPSLYLQYSDDDNFEIRVCAAASLHEAFKLIEDNDDISTLKKVFLSFILDGSREIHQVMNENLDLMILKYGNKHTLENFKGRTPYIDSQNSDEGSDNNSKEVTPNSKKGKNSTNTDFTSAFNEERTLKKALTKKNTTHLCQFDNLEEDATPKLPPIYTTPDYESELLYSDLLQRLMAFVNNIRSQQGNWREHVKLIKNLKEVIHLFYMPEIHQYLVPLLMEFLEKGNREIKEAACDCLAKILNYQHHSPSREELLKLVQQELCQSTNWMQRKTFIYFCRYVIKYMPREFFKRYFLKDYIACSQDKVPHVRMEFANAMLIIKPYFDNDVDLSLELMDILNNLNNDPDRDVQEAVEHTDYELLQQRKKNKGAVDDSQDEEKQQFQKQLQIREMQEQEEKKKRCDDDEEGKTDMASYIAESKRWRQKAGKYSYNRKPIGTFGSTKSLLGSSMNTLKKLPLGQIDGEAKAPAIKKAKIQKTKSSITNGFNQGDIDFTKQRKSSLLIGGSKDDQIKRYHAMVSNGSQQTNGGTQRQNTGQGTSNKSGQKPRRNTVMGVGGQIPGSSQNGL